MNNRTPLPPKLIRLFSIKPNPENLEENIKINFCFSKALDCLKTISSKNKNIHSKNIKSSATRVLNFSEATRDDKEFKEVVTGLLDSYENEQRSLPKSTQTNPKSNKA